jgi:OHCU decarboxylase
LLRAHPDLAGRLAMAGELTAQSTAEQAAAGLDQCSPEQLQAFQRLNAAYTARFGIPFIIAVRGLTRATILERFAQRLGNSQATEMRIALEEVHRIARLRLYQLADSDERRSALKP